MREDTYLTEITRLLPNSVTEQESIEILNTMISVPISNYTKGKILTVGEIKKLPNETIIHIWYEDEHGVLREDGFDRLYEYDGNDEMITYGGYTIPLEHHKNSELIENFDNCGWTFTVRETNINKKQ